MRSIYHFCGYLAPVFVLKKPYLFGRFSSYAEAQPLDLIKGHLTDARYIPVSRGLPQDFNPVNWFKPSLGYSPNKDFHYVAKIQRFESGGYETTIVQQDLKRLAALSDAPRSTGKRVQGEQDENNIVSSVIRSKRMMRYKIKSMGCDRLLTLTRREIDLNEFWTVQQWAAAWDRFNRLCKKMGVPIEYVAVLERHKKGNYHLHAAINKHIPINQIRALWWSCCGGRGLGNVDIKFRKEQSPHKRRAGIAKYVSKYVAKQIGQTEFNKKRYWSSRHKLPSAVRYILNSDDLFSAMNEFCGFMGLSLSKLSKQAYQFGGGVGAWFSFDDDLLASPPF